MERDVIRAVRQVALGARFDIAAVSEENSAANLVNDALDSNVLQRCNEQLKLGATGWLHRGAEVNDGLILVSVTIEVLVNDAIVVAVYPACICENLLGKLRAVVSRNLARNILVEGECWELKIGRKTAGAALDLIKVALAVYNVSDRLADRQFRCWAPTTARCAGWKHTINVCLGGSPVAADRRGEVRAKELNTERIESPPLVAQVVGWGVLGPVKVGDHVELASAELCGTGFN